VTMMKDSRKSQVNKEGTEMSESGAASQSELLFLRQKDFDARLPEREVLSALRVAFAGLANGTAVQPPQSAGVVPDQLDVIYYPGILAGQNVFGAKFSPYFLKRTNGPKVTAWTILFSATTGEPVLLCDSLALTVERTAATTGLALELLTPPRVSRLAIIGTGSAGIAHLRYALAVHEWKQIHLYSRSLHKDSSVTNRVPAALRDRITIADSARSAVMQADVILLCTSSGTPVIDHRWLRPGQLVTSITTNLPDAHEIAPESLAALEVYCDYRATTPMVAGEMKLALQAHGWTAHEVRGDLPELISGRAQKPSGNAPIFFRSVGLGIEDLAIATALLSHRNAAAQVQ
jgi:L-arginine dehydrogenase